MFSSPMAINCTSESGNTTIPSFKERTESGWALTGEAGNKAKLSKKTKINAIHLFTFLPSLFSDFLERSVQRI